MQKKFWILRLLQYPARLKLPKKCSSNFFLILKFSFRDECWFDYTNKARNKNFSTLKAFSWIITCVVCCIGILMRRAGRILRLVGTFRPSTSSFFCRTNQLDSFQEGFSNNTLLGKEFSTWNYAISIELPRF